MTEMKTVHQNEILLPWGRSMVRSAQSEPVKVTVVLTDERVIPGGDVVVDAHITCPVKHDLGNFYRGTQGWSKK